MQKLLRALIALTLLFPHAAIAVGSGSLQIDDVIAGLEAHAELRGFASHDTVELHIEAPYAGETIVTVRTDNTGGALAAIPSRLTEEAGTYEAFVLSTIGQSGRVRFTVLPDRMDARASVMEADSASLRSDGQSELTVSVILVDRFGNPLAGRPVELISSRTEDRITALTRETDEGGSQHFTVQTRKPGQISLRAMDFLSGTMLASSLRITAGDDETAVGGDAPAARTRSLTAQLTDDTFGDEEAPAPASRSGFGTIDRFEVSINPAAPKVNDVVDLTIRAVDSSGNTVEDYTGTANIYAPDDPGASLPVYSEGHGVAIFSPKNLGRKLLPLSVSFSMPGAQTLVVTDESDPENIIQGELMVTVEDSEDFSPERRIEILSHRQDGTVTGTRILLEGIGPAYANLEVTGGSDDAFGETDDKGNFGIAVTLDASVNEFTLRVRDETRRYDSGPLRLVRDGEGPPVDFSFDPTEPQEDDDVLLEVQSEPRLGSVKMILGDQELSLSEEPRKPGTYRVLFRAPLPGEYQPSIIAADEAGNETEVRTKLTVTERGLPTVTNIRAEPKFSSVDLSWDPVEGEEIDSYLIYVGTGADVFYSTLDTLEPRESVSVLGLKPGDTYYFAVTAKKDGRESNQSRIVSAVPLGLALGVTPQDGSLLLDWKFPDERVDTFILEYGIEKDKYSERRVITGNDRVYVLRDLVNGVTYHLRMTPVAVTGEPLTEMAATTTGTPGGDGFTPSAEDPVPFDPSEILPPDLHGSAPSTPGSGLPGLAIPTVIILSIAAFAFYWRRRTLAQNTQQFLGQMQKNYRRY